MISGAETLLASWLVCDGGLDGLADQAARVAQYESHPRAAQILHLAEAKLRGAATERALAHLLYAQRLAPSSDLITLLVGDLRLHLGQAEAVDPFGLLARRGDWNAAWYRLALAHLRFGQVAHAAAAMGETLSRNAPLLDAAATGLLDGLLFATGGRGWCGLTQAGDLIVGGPAIGRRAPRLAVLADGQSLPLGRPVRAAGFIRFALGRPILAAHRVEVTSGGHPLLGSALQPQAVARCDGFVERTETGIAGWCGLPGDPLAHPRLHLHHAVGDIALVARDLVETPHHLERLFWRRHFFISANDLPPGRITVTGPQGQALYGSPLMVPGEVDSGLPGRHRRRRPAQVAAPPRQTLVAIPAYRGLDATVACIRSVLTHRAPGEVILVISDASPDPALVAALQHLAETADILLRLESVNRGFPATANLALRQAAAAGQDIVLLNSDTLVTPNWLAGLRRAAYAAPDSGTATPFSNAATILSYPSTTQANAVPTEREAEALAALFAAENGTAAVEIPTGHGFCLFIRHDCLVETGLFREDRFAQGYGEENDFCMRARRLGWRHVAAAGCFVAHREGQSFAAARDCLAQRNLRVLNTLHPGYDRLIAEWEQADPLAGCRREVDQARLRALQGDRRTVGFVTHDREGGVQRQVRRQAQRVEAAGFLALILRPSRSRGGRAQCLIETLSAPLPNLAFAIPDEGASLAAFLKTCRLAHVELHHFIGHEPGTIDMVRTLGVPFDLHLHDYAWFCPRITLTAPSQRYCGEPALKQCEDCVRDRGGALDRDITPGRLIAWSADLFAGARKVVAPTADTAARYRRRFAVRPTIEPWEEEPPRFHGKAMRPMVPGGIRKICLAGAIGHEKGYQVVLDCARLAQTEDLPVLFQIVGFTCDDDPLLETGKVTITGRYHDSEAIALIAAQKADLAFLPALWPETWSFVLTQLWQAGLPVVAFDIGAPAERIRRHGGGSLLPLGLPPRRIIHALCHIAASTRSAA